MLTSTQIKLSYIFNKWSSINYDVRLPIGKSKTLKKNVLARGKEVVGVEENLGIGSVELST